MTAMLASIPDYEAWTGATVPPESVAHVEGLLASVSGLVQAAARQQIVRVDGDLHLLAGDSSSILWLPQQPVVSVQQVAVEGAVLPDAAWTLLSHGRLRKESGCWGGIETVVEVTYTHGWTVIPADIVAITCAAAARSAANPSGKTYERIDDYAVGFSSAGPNPELTEFEAAALKQYWPRVPAR